MMFIDDLGGFVNLVKQKRGKASVLYFALGLTFIFQITLKRMET